MKRDPLRLAIALGALAGSFVVQPAKADDGWDWTLVPYIWATAVKVDVREGAPATDAPGGGASGDVGPDFDDVVDKLKFAFLGHLEGQGDDFGAFADLIYLDLGDDRRFERADLETDLSSTIFELAMVWAPGDQRFEGFEGFAGLRYMDVDVELRIDPEPVQLAQRTVEVDKGFTDVLLGARYTVPLSDKWAVSARADTSFGDSEGTWSANVLLRRHYANGALLLGYRYFQLEVQPRDSSFDIDLYGPMIGYAFTW